MLRGLRTSCCSPLSILASSSSSSPIPTLHSHHSSSISSLASLLPSPRRNPTSSTAGPLKADSFFPSAAQNPSSARSLSTRAHTCFRLPRASAPHNNCKHPHSPPVSSAAASPPRFGQNPKVPLRAFSASAGPASTTETDTRSPMATSSSIRVIPQKELYVSTPTWWLESRFHFSFAEYRNPANNNFGVLRVLNDDLVQPRSGFGRHPHRNMEILTYVVDGKLTHKDSMGTEETLGRGSVQYMSAGTGITHSEMNNADELLRFLQIWILPQAQGLTPNYGSRSFAKEDRHNKFQQVVTSYDALEGDTDTGTGLIPIHQDVTMHVAEMDPGQSLAFSLARRRQVYAVCIEGAVEVTEGAATYKLKARDALEAVNTSKEDMPLEFVASSDGAHVFVIEMSSKV